MEVLSSQRGCLRTTAQAKKVIALAVTLAKTPTRVTAQVAQACVCLVLDHPATSAKGRNRREIFKLWPFLFLPKGTKKSQIYPKFLDWSDQRTKSG
jgi:hypothetical protein